MASKRILLINIDSTIPNLALKKIEKYHRDLGHEVIWDNELMQYSCDKIYVSCVFTKNREKCLEWEGRAIIGGSGYDMKIRLPENIERVKPRINWGFTTRGCIRKCKFCFVPKMEGKIYKVGEIDDIWDGASPEITLMDNNILALPDHFVKMCKQISDRDLWVDFNQGLDIRLLYKNDTLLEALRSVKSRRYRFAWDNEDEMMPVRLEWLKKEIGTAQIYVLAGLDPFERVMHRLETIKKFGHRPYLMRHESVYKEKLYVELARWANTCMVFAKTTFDEYCKLQNVTIKLL